MTDLSTSYISSGSQGSVDEMSQYIEILEKTNQQLGLWTNPYGVMVGVISVLFAVLAIFVAFALWRQSKEQREQARLQLEKQHEAWIERQKIWETEAEKRLIVSEEKLEGLLKKKKEKLSKLEKTDGEARKRLEETIERLEEEQAKLPAVSFHPSNSITLNPGYYGRDLTWGGMLSSDVHKCSQCGFGYEVDGYDPARPVTTKGIFDLHVLRCPKCGNID